MADAVMITTFQNESNQLLSCAPMARPQLHGSCVKVHEIALGRRDDCKKLSEINNEAASLQPHWYGLPGNAPRRADGEMLRVE